MYLHIGLNIEKLSRTAKGQLLYIKANPGVSLLSWMPVLVKARQRVSVWADAMSAEDRGKHHPRQERARMSHMDWKNDTYKQARGGYARLLAVSCATCGTHLFYYQKDGPGIVKRLYLDRIYQSHIYESIQHRALKDIPQLLCPQCGEHLGIPMIYQKEQRLAFRLFEGAVTKKIRKRH